MNFTYKMLSAVYQQKGNLRTIAGAILITTKADVTILLFFCIFILYSTRFHYVAHAGDPPVSSSPVQGLQVCTYLYSLNCLFLSLLLLHVVCLNVHLCAHRCEQVYVNK